MSALWLAFTVYIFTVVISVLVNELLALHDNCPLVKHLS